MILSQNNNFIFYLCAHLIVVIVIRFHFGRGGLKVKYKLELLLENLNSPEQSKVRLTPLSPLLKYL